MPPVLSKATRKIQLLEDLFVFADLWTAWLPLRSMQAHPQAGLLLAGSVRGAQWLSCRCGRTYSWQVSWVCFCHLASGMPLHDSLTVSEMPSWHVHGRGQQVLRTPIDSCGGMQR